MMPQERNVTPHEFPYLTIERGRRRLVDFAQPVR
jgi:hypothetical protein